MGKIVKNTVFTILFLFLVTTTALLAYLHFFASDDRNLSGEWTAKLDMTEQAAVAAFCWLQDMEAVSVSLEDIESHMQGLNVEIHLTMQQTTRSEGTFRCSVLTESYDACIQAAYDAYAAVFRDLLVERLRMAGYTGDTDEESIDALVTETFGMSTVSYLNFCNPNLLPPLEELQAQYDGSGTYEATEDILTRRYDGSKSATARKELYIRKGDSLILSEEDSVDHGLMIYTLDKANKN